MPAIQSQRVKRVPVQINGTTVSGIEGQSILEVAREYGIHVPTLCYHPKLEPLGSCRLCVVEVKGTLMPVTACTTPISKDMVIHTHTPFLEELRRETLKLIFLRHPMNCGACEINGNCQLQDLAHAYDISHADFHTYEYRAVDYPVEPYATPIIKYHPRRCILCGRCVQACSEITSARAIRFKGRGAETCIGPVEGEAGAGSGCVSCGECMAICPANALTEAMGPQKGKAWETCKVQTTCPYCGVGCQMELNVVSDKVVGVTPVDGSVNQGDLCSKGRFGYCFINHRDRIRHPLIRKNGYWEEVTWDQALDHISDRLLQIRADYGPDAIGALSSARCTNEENYIFQKFFRGVIGTNNVDHCARL
jgi:predicted molibdopterin-dependent oxidoreductase YjgC